MHQFKMQHYHQQAKIWLCSQMSLILASQIINWAMWIFQESFLMQTSHSLLSKITQIITFLAAITILLLDNGFLEVLVVSSLHTIRPLTLWIVKQTTSLNSQSSIWLIFPPLHQHLHHPTQPLTTLTHRDWQCHWLN